MNNNNLAILIVNAGIDNLSSLIKSTEADIRRESDFDTKIELQRKCKELKNSLFVLKQNNYHLQDAITDALNK